MTPLLYTKSFFLFHFDRGLHYSFRLLFSTCLVCFHFCDKRSDCLLSEMLADLHDAETARQHGQPRESDYS